MVVETYAAESAVAMVAGLVDQGYEDYAVEAAISKVFATEALWRTTDEALQIAGGNGYMREYPYERALRDCRIFRILEGTNDILRLFIALTAMNDVGAQLADLAASLKGVLERSDQGLRGSERVRAAAGIAGDQRGARAGRVHPAQPGAEGRGRGVRGAHPGAGDRGGPDPAQARQAHRRHAVRHPATGGHHDRPVRDGLRAVAGGRVRAAAGRGGGGEGAGDPARLRRSGAAAGAEQLRGDRRQRRRADQERSPTTPSPRSGSAGTTCRRRAGERMARAIGGVERGTVRFFVVAVCLAVVLPTLPRLGAAAGMAALVLALAAAWLVWRWVPESLTGGQRRRPVVAGLWALSALLALLQMGRLSAFMEDPERTWGSVVPDPIAANHACLSAYVVAADLSRRGTQNLYDERFYPAFSGDAARLLAPASVHGLQKWMDDPFEYPPPFLLFPRAALLATDDFLAIRAGWFVLQALGLIVVAAWLARWIGGRDGQLAFLLLPVLLASLPTMLGLQFGQFHITTLLLAVAAMICFEERRPAVGGALLAVATVSKLFPAFLLVYLLARRRWRRGWPGRWRGASCSRWRGSPSWAGPRSRRSSPTSCPDHTRRGIRLLREGGAGRVAQPRDPGAGDEAPVPRSAGDDARAGSAPRLALHLSGCSGSHGPRAEERRAGLPPKLGPGSRCCRSRSVPVQPALRHLT